MKIVTEHRGPFPYTNEFNASTTTHQKHLTHSHVILECSRRAKTIQGRTSSLIWLIGNSWHEAG